MPIGTDVKQYLAVDLRFSKLAASRKVDGILVIGRLFKTIRLGKLRSHKSPNRYWECSASTSVLAYSFEMYEGRSGAPRQLIVQSGLLGGRTFSDQEILHAELMKWWLPYIYGV
ncbi:hypothetical protein L596_004374 [Steinernema carpocapsae]|uniref:Uncharacterized protein n=1 Tax=Steinernema carpocapsae TaxID=34508 RepID=A0A4V6I848_STECR|nr:hypothetical protein L596_004374 [Steinernema carpocapsae]